MSGLVTLDRAFYDRAPDAVAMDLLNKVFVSGHCRGRIVEVEAYDGSSDPASHAFRGSTPRNRTMFGPPGHLYVYFTYGMHFCCNVVCREDSEPAAVLLRSVQPLSGIETMKTRRGPIRSERDLTAGPARLCQALGVDRAHDGLDLVERELNVSVEDDGVCPPSNPGKGSRVGTRVGLERMWRFWVPESSWLSKPAVHHET